MADNQDTASYLMTSSDEADEQQRLGKPFPVFATTILIWLDLQHQIWLLTLHGRLHTSSLPSHIGSILDIGCGTGAWAFAIAKERPTTHVMAIDLTPPNITPPSNVTLVKTDAEKEWEFDMRFGFIHGRMLTSGIHNWPKFLSRCWDHLEPGGWLELLDVCHPFRAKDPAVDNNSSNFIKWGLVAEACWAMNGLDYRATTKHSERLRELGFVDISEEERAWPLGPWPELEHERRIGELTLSNFNTFLARAGVFIISQDTSITAREAQDLVAAAQSDLMENCCNKRFYLTVKIHAGRKPEKA